MKFKRLCAVLLAITLALSGVPVPAAIAANQPMLDQQVLQSFVDTTEATNGKSNSELGLSESKWNAEFIGYCANHSKLRSSLGVMPDSRQNLPLQPVQWLCLDAKAATFYSFSQELSQQLTDHYGFDAPGALQQIAREDFHPHPGDLVLFTSPQSLFSHVAIVTNVNTNDVTYIGSNYKGSGQAGTLVKQSTTPLSNAEIIGYAQIPSCSHNAEYQTTGFCSICQSWLPNQNDQVSVDTTHTYRVKADTPATIYSRPYSVSTYVNRPLGTIRSGTPELHVLKAVQNGLGELWYYVKWELGHMTGYTPAECLQMETQILPANISASSLPIPYNLREGQSDFSLSAELQSESCTISGISGKIISESDGTVVQVTPRYTTPAGTTIYNTSGKAIDDAFQFQQLAAGRYHYELTLSASTMLTIHDEEDPRVRTFSSEIFEIYSKKHIHSYDTLDCEETHPHRYFEVCSCGDRHYTGENAVLPSCVYCSGVTMTLDPAGGTVTPADITVFPGAPLGALPVPVRKGSQFMGWYLGDTLFNQDTICQQMEPFTLSAHWAAHCRLTFNGNGGFSPLPSISVLSGKPLGELPVPSWPDHIFDGWYSAPEGGTLCTADTLFTGEQDTELYAHWYSVYPVIYRSQLPADGMPAEQSKIQGQSLTLSTAVPTASGATFLHWASGKNPSEVFHPGDIYELDQPLTLVAVWSQKASGTFPENPDAAWTLTGNVLTISGTGAVPALAPNTDSPWARYGERVHSIILESGITGIGSQAFQDCPNLEAITLPDSCLAIDSSAFHACTKLQSVICSGDFTRWTRSVSITGEHNRFDEISITFPKYPNPSGTCGRNNRWELRNGTLILSGTGTMPDYDEQHPAPWPADHVYAVQFDAPVPRLGTGTFADCKNLRQISFPDAITSIPAYTFSGCTGLEELLLPPTLLQIDAHAFSGCTGTLTVFCKTGMEQWTRMNIAAEGNDVLNNASVQIAVARGSCGPDIIWNLGPDGILTISGTGAMNDYSQTADAQVPWRDYHEVIRQVRILDGVTSVGTMAFVNHNHLEKVWLPATVTSIRPGAFLGCTALQLCSYMGSAEHWNTISIDADNEPLLSARLCCLRGSCGPSLEWTLEDNSVLHITGTGDMDNFTAGGAPWYSYRDSITEILLENTVTGIGDYAFADLPRATKVELPDGLKRIGDYALASSAFYELFIPSSVQQMGPHALSGANVSKLHILCSADSAEALILNCPKLSILKFHTPLTTLRTGALSGAPCLEKIYLPETLQQIQPGTFANCPLKELYYGGTSAEWSQVKIGAENGPFAPDMQPTPFQLFASAKPCDVGHYIMIRTKTEATCDKNGLIILECRDCDYMYYMPSGAPHTPVPTEAIAPTCTKAGRKAGTVCSVCGQIVSGCSEIPPQGHTYHFEPNYNGTHQATCIYGDSGTATELCDRKGPNGSCSLCGADFCLYPAELCPHASAVHKLPLSGSCRSHRILEHWYCPDCNTYFRDASLSPASIVPWDTLELPTDPHAHISSHVAYIPGKDPTCTEDGYSPCMRCLDCGIIVDTREILPATGHQLTQYEGKAPTCTEPGYAPYEVCSKCNYTTYTELPATGHSSEWRYERVNEIPPTFDTAGSYVRVGYCKICGMEMERTTVILPPLSEQARVWINGKGYPTLSAAFTAAKDGDVIALTRDHGIIMNDPPEENAPVFVKGNRNLTLDLGGNMLTQNVIANAMTGLNVEGGTLTVRNGRLLGYSTYGTGLHIENCSVILESSVCTLGSRFGVTLSGNASLIVKGTINGGIGIYATGENNFISIQPGAVVQGNQHAISANATDTIEICGGFVDGDIIGSGTVITGGTFTEDLSSSISPGYTCTSFGPYYTVMSEPQVPVTGITLNPSQAELVTGETLQLTASLQPQDSKDQTLVWTSSDPTTASVQDGLVTALKPGSVKITVSIPEQSVTASCDITIVPGKILEFQQAKSSSPDSLVFSAELTPPAPAGSVAVALYSSTGQMLDYQVQSAATVMEFRFARQTRAAYAKLMWLGKASKPVCNSAFCKLS